MSSCLSITPSVLVGRLSAAAGTRARCCWCQLAEVSGGQQGPSRWALTDEPWQFLLGQPLELCSPSCPVCGACSTGGAGAQLRPAACEAAGLC